MKMQLLDVSASLNYKEFVTWPVPAVRFNQTHNYLACYIWH